MPGVVSESALGYKSTTMRTKTGNPSHSSLYQRWDGYDVIAAVVDDLFQMLSELTKDTCLEFLNTQDRGSIVQGRLFQPYLPTT